MTALSRIKEKFSLLTKDPICDIEETKSHTILSLDIPNVPLEDLDVSVSGRNLFIEVNRQHKSATDKEDTKVIQCHHQNFFRTFSFPIALSPEEINAYYQNGILRVAVPKTNVLTKHKIAVHSGPVGVFLTSKAKAQLEKTEPIESFSDIDDYDWE